MAKVPQGRWRREAIAGGIVRDGKIWYSERWDTRILDEDCMEIYIDMRFIPQRKDRLALMLCNPYFINSN